MYNTVRMVAIAVVYRVSQKEVLLFELILREN